MNDQTHPDDTHPMAGDGWLPDPPVTMPTCLLRSTIETLTWLDEFLRCHASGAVHAELDAFCQAQGRGGGGSANFVIDAIGLDLYRLRRASLATTDHQETTP